MNERQFCSMLDEVLMNGDLDEEVNQIDSFQEQGLMTNNKGLVVFMKDGSAFQVQVVQSAFADDDEDDEDDE